VEKPDQSQQRELTVRHAKETEREMQKRLDVQKVEYEETIKRHIAFIDQVGLSPLFLHTAWRGVVCWTSAELSKDWLEYTKLWLRFAIPRVCYFKGPLFQSASDGWERWCLFKDLIGPIPWGHSSPLCHALSSSSSWTSMRRRHATRQ